MKNSGERFPIFTIAFLLLGIIVGLLFLRYCIQNTRTSFIDNFPERCFPLLLAALGIIMAEIGIVLLFLKKRAGFDTFVAGGAFFAIMFATRVCNLPRFEEWSEFIEVSLIFLAAVLVVDFILYRVLLIKNKQGVSAWQMLHSRVSNN